MSSRKHILAFGLLVAAATTVPAYAQSTAASATPNLPADFPVCTKTNPSASDTDIAKQKFIAARQDYEEGAYDSALRRFKDAYASDCTKPEVLLIVSATYERKGDRPSALAALETYVQRAGKDAADMATTQAKIENLKKQIAAQPPPTATATATAPTSEPREHTIYPWIVAGVGAAGIVTGIIFFVTRPTKPPDCSLVTNRCVEMSHESTAVEYVDFPKLGLGFTIGGGVALLGGLVWHFLEPTGPDKGPSSHLTPTAGPGFAGLSFDTKF